jgi:uncharacterized LabA/DUF88 family protein
VIARPARVGLNPKSQPQRIFGESACSHSKNWNKVERFGTGIAYNESRICDQAGRTGRWATKTGIRARNRNPHNLRGAGHMQRVAILVDGWNLLKAADRLKRRVNLAELAHAALAHGPDRYIAFQRFYIGPNSGFGTTQRVERLADQVRSLGYEWVQCSTEGAYPKTVVDAHIIMDILTWSYCHSVDVIALYSGDGDYAEAAR